MTSSYHLILKMDQNNPIICVTSTEPWLIMLEYAPEGSLQEYLQRHRPGQQEVVINHANENQAVRLQNQMLDPHKLLALAAQICSGLDHLQRFKVCTSSSSLCLIIFRGLWWYYLMRRRTFDFCSWLYPQSNHSLTPCLSIIFQLIYYRLKAARVLVGKGGICKLSGFGFPQEVKERNLYEVVSRKLLLSWAEVIYVMAGDVLKDDWVVININMYLWYLLWYLLLGNMRPAICSAWK